MTNQNGASLSQTSDPKVIEAFTQEPSRLFDRPPVPEGMFGPVGPVGTPGIAGHRGMVGPAGPTAKVILRARACALREAADHLDLLADMTPEVLSPEQEAALMFIAQSAQLAV